MLINEELLYQYGAVIQNLQKQEYIFHEGDVPKNYYQILEGRVKLSHNNEEGKEFIQTILTDGQSACELLLFIDYNYPVSCVALENSTILKLSKPNFEKLLDDHPTISRDLNVFFAGRLYQKLVMLQNNASLNPEIRLKGIMSYYKSFNHSDKIYSFEIPFTRQELASFTGLRVETVIRAFKKMEVDKIVRIENRKIYY
jgi:CRP-like cAMP-binding protein